MQNRPFIALLLGLALLAGRAQAVMFATDVVNYQVGLTPGSFTNTQLALGGPQGGGGGQGSLDVVSLGQGGSITLGFTSNGVPCGITNAAGFDFIVFENAFYVGRDSNSVYAETAFVEVSSDGANFARFASQSTAPNGGPYSTTNYTGLAGTAPVFANVTSTNSPDPFDSTVAGGDAFDLSSLTNNALVLGGQVDLNFIRFIRLVDIVTGASTDSFGNIIYDYTFADSGFDLDAVSVIHVIPEPSPLAILLLGLPFLGLLGRRFPVRPPSVKASPSTKAFSLVELLVAVAIMGLLASLLAPALSSSKGKARSAQCMNNLRQLFLANNLYADENDDKFALAAENILTLNTKRWHGRRVSSSGVFDPSKGPLTAYLGANGRVKECPSLRNFIATAGFERGNGGYGYNEVYVGGIPDDWDNTIPRSRSDITQPDRVVMFGDSAIAINAQGIVEYSFIEPPYYSDLATSYDPTLHFRHQGRANVVWCDGHVSSETMSKTVSSSPAYPGAKPDKNQLGWFGPITQNAYWRVP